MLGLHRCARTAVAGGNWRHRKMAVPDRHWLEIRTAKRDARGYIYIYITIYGRPRKCPRYHLRGMAPLTIPGGLLRKLTRRPLHETTTPATNREGPLGENSTANPNVAAEKQQVSIRTLQGGGRMHVGINYVKQMPTICQRDAAKMSNICDTYVESESWQFDFPQRQYCQLAHLKTRLPSTWCKQHGNKTAGKRGHCKRLEAAKFKRKQLGNTTADKWTSIHVSLCDSAYLPTHLVNYSWGCIHPH